MKTGYLFLMVLFIVLAIPLFADHALVNPVGEFSAISTINSQEDFLNIKELPYDHIAVLDVGIKKSYLLDTNYERLNANADIGNGLKKYKNIFWRCSLDLSSRH